ncbi:hypothetical protein UFOVP328_98 [uncultured Caudovirales phage]|uniref:Uncharacterized protein n=1 Tax=uncultured Caudovirales phage TaxID=2100421 RepID=A0A6J5M1F7_9CAUD|nr:hypothetical protein UFOVP328_98 [uncultured Caudovirales phage]
MILNDLFESRMSDLNIQYQDYKDMSSGGFYSRYKMTKDDWASKNWSLIKGSQTVHEENQDDRNARIIAGEIEDAAAQGNEQLVKQKIKELISVGYTLNKAGELQRMGMYEGAVKDFYTELGEKYQELAPKIERHRDSYLAGELYDALEEIAAKHGAIAEFRKMMNGARNRAHMDYDTNPGGFQNWFWYLPFADEELSEEQDACYRKVKSRYKVWPSAYASGALVQCRKKGAANWGNKTKK